MKLGLSSRLASPRLGRSFVPTLLASAVGMALLGAGHIAVADESVWLDVLPDSREQINAASTGVQLGFDDGIGALIRVARAVDVNGTIGYRPERTIPPMAALLKPVPLANDPDLYGEKIPLPSTALATKPYSSRQMKFRLVGRDNRGGVSVSDTALTVVRTGKSFSVLSPTTVYLKPSQALTVQWEIAGTNAPVYNCPKLTIEITNNGGVSFSRLGLDVSNTPISPSVTRGQASVVLPANINASVPSNIRIRCANDSNIFFAVSKQNPYIFAR